MMVRSPEPRNGEKGDPMTIRVRIHRPGQPGQAHRRPPRTRRASRRPSTTSTEAPVEELVGERSQGGGDVPREVGASADVVGICVPEDEHVRAVVLGDDGLLAGMTARRRHPDPQHSPARDRRRGRGGGRAEGCGGVIDACVTGRRGPRRDQADHLSRRRPRTPPSRRRARYFEATSDVEHRSTPASSATAPS